MKRLTAVFLFGAAFAVQAPASADDLKGAGKLLCSVGTVRACYEDGECDKIVPADLNLPQFVEVDLEQKRLATTKASGESRSTPIINLIRENGHIVVQGYEMGRAFSFMIDEAMGYLTVAVATDGLTISVNGACTPLSSSR